MDINSKIFVANDRDMIGGAILKSLKNKGYSNIIIWNDDENDLTNEQAVAAFFEEEKPEYVFYFTDDHGGIIYNVTRPAELMYKNMKSEVNVLHQSYISGVKKLLFLTGNCVYPKNSLQPILEHYFMDGKMEPTSEPYSTARAAGIVMCGAYNKQYGTSFVPAVLTNYYGPGDDYSENGHVLASVMKKMYTAKKEGKDLTLWGDGTPKRQFMHIDDMADAAVFIMEKYDGGLINIAGGKELSIKELSGELARITGFKGNIKFDSDKPNGAMRKLLDNSKLLELGFKENVSFEEGLMSIYEDFLRNGCEQP